MAASAWQPTDGRVFLQKSQPYPAWKSLVTVKWLGMSSNVALGERDHIFDGASLCRSSPYLSFSPSIWPCLGVPFLCVLESARLHHCLNTPRLWVSVSSLLLCKSGVSPLHSVRVQDILVSALFIISVPLLASYSYSYLCSSLGMQL